MLGVVFAIGPVLDLEIVAGICGRLKCGLFIVDDITLGAKWGNGC